MSASLWPRLKLLDKGFHVLLNGVLRGGFFLTATLVVAIAVALIFHCFLLLSARLGVFVSHPERSETKTTERQTGKNDDRSRRSTEWQARQVTNLFCGFGAQSALARRGGPERLYAEGTTGWRKWSEDARSAYP